MQKTLVSDAPAKINIGLWVSPYTTPYPEGNFHEIAGIFKTVALCDTLTMRFDDAAIEQNTLTVECSGAGLPKNNTLSKTFDAFCSISGITHAQVELSIEKRIPQGAGLGGGSSDAATFLRSLDAVYKTHLTHAQFEQAASRVGSDVFFFLFGCGLAVAGGRGEKVQPIPENLGDKAAHIVLIYPDVSSSTAEAYALVDAWYTANAGAWKAPLSEAPPSKAQLLAEYEKPVSTWRFVNTFTKPLVQKYPAIADALIHLRDVGASFVQMSGSGSAVYGVFTGKAEAEKAYTLLHKRWQNCYYCS